MIDLIIRAPAKINLSLQVVGTRPDGYHELRTIFQSIALHDTLRIERVRGPFQLECENPACPSDETNLVWRAAEEVWAATGRRGAVRDITIQLVKRIPIAGGLGGGSSDAAAAIRGVGTLLGLKPERFREIAASLGADIPYFLEGGTVLGLDRGDTLFRLVDEPPAWVVLVVPGFGVSTKDAYRWWDRAESLRRPVLDTRERDGSSVLSAGVGLRGSGKGGAPRGVRKVWAARWSNDLEGVVALKHPEIGRLVRALNRSGASHAAMSGSGSTVFGLFRTQRAAARAAASLRRRDHIVIVTKTIDHVTYQHLQGSPGPPGRLSVT